MVEVVPAAMHEVTPAQTTLCNSPVFAGTLAAVHVVPPSLLTAIAPCPCPAVVAVNPVTRQRPSATQVRDPASLQARREAAPALPDWRPKSTECADQNVVPSVAMTVQSMGLEHSTLVITVAPAGTATAAHDAPALRVVTTMPAEPDPLRPTAMQR